jgi:hypothetical protein
MPYAPSGSNGNGRRRRRGRKSFTYVWWGIQDMKLNVMPFPPEK